MPRAGAGAAVSVNRAGSPSVTAGQASMETVGSSGGSTIVPMPTARAMFASKASDSTSCRVSSPSPSSWSGCVATRISFSVSKGANSSVPPAGL